MNMFKYISLLLVCMFCGETLAASSRSETDLLIEYISTKESPDGFKPDPLLNFGGHYRKLANLVEADLQRESKNRSKVVFLGLKLLQDKTQSKSFDDIICGLSLLVLDDPDNGGIIKRYVEDGVAGKINSAIKRHILANPSVLGLAVESRVYDDEPGGLTDSLNETRLIQFIGYGGLLEFVTRKDVTKLVRQRILLMLLRNKRLLVYRMTGVVHEDDLKLSAFDASEYPSAGLLLDMIEEHVSKDPKFKRALEWHLAGFKKEEMGFAVSYGLSGQLDRLLTLAKKIKKDAPKEWRAKIAWFVERSKTQFGKYDHGSRAALIKGVAEMMESAEVKNKSPIKSCLQELKAAGKQAVCTIYQKHMYTAYKKGDAWMPISSLCAKADQ